jgi:RHS repeat-associated protein
VATPTGLTLTAGDVNHALLWSRNGTGSGKTHAWSPYGKGDATDGLPGFNGERPDPVSGAYHQGNGYRAYNPVLRRFNCPDSLSPFGAGGINPYAYCLGDPVNRTDPTGHISWQGIVGIVTGVIGLGLSLFTAGASIAAAGSVTAALSSVSRLGLTIGLMGVAADVTAIASGATEDVNPEVSSVLGWVSMATGIAGVGAGISLAFKRVKVFKHTTAHGDSIHIELNTKPAVYLHSHIKNTEKDITRFRIPRTHILSPNNITRLKNIELNKMLYSQPHQRFKDTSIPVMKKKVHFNEEIRELLFKSSESRSPEKTLSILDRAYRSEMDTMAKKRGLPFALGHDHFDSGPKYYNHNLAVSEYSKLIGGSEKNI